jgi:hypothetical protein
MTNRKWVPIVFENSWIDRILSLRLKVFGEHSYTKARWMWQYIDNPQGKANLLLAIDKETNSTLAGHYAIMAYQVRAFNNIYSISQSVDTFTSEDFRNQGIFVELANITYEEAKNSNVLGVFGFPNSNSYPGFVKKLGFQDPFSLQFYSRPITFGVIFKKLKINSRFTKFVSFIPLIFKPKHSFIKYQTSNSIPLDWNELLQKFEKNTKIATARSSDYMNWRYIRCPDRKYTFLEFRKDNSLIGFVVLAVTNDDYPTGQIVDIVFENIADVDYFIKQSIWQLYLLNAHTATFYTHKENILAPLFNKINFKSRGSEIRFIIKNFGNIPNYEANFLNPNNWYITGGDTDYL